MCLQNSCHDGVGPKALRWTVLRLHLLGFGSWVGVTGVQHGLKDTPTGVDKPARGVTGGERTLGVGREEDSPFYEVTIKKGLNLI